MPAQEDRSLAAPLTPIVDVPINLFPIEKYNQDVDHWLPPDAPDYKTPLLSKEYQQQRLADLYRHLYSTEADGLSPWSATFVATYLKSDPSVLAVQQQAISNFGPQEDPNKMGYGENFHPYLPTWIQTISTNMNLDQFAAPLSFNAAQRGIIVQNTDARILPTRDPHFYNFTLPGQGYPFDNLQESVIWVGTPVYILGTTQDGAWSLVMTSSFTDWVATEVVAKVSTEFINSWNAQVLNNLAVITRTQAPVINADSRHFQFSGYVGTLLPLLNQSENQYTILIPLKDSNGNANPSEALVSTLDAGIVPLLATREIFAKLFRNLQNRPYGWGGSCFYNDCSQEMQSIFAALGIWVPRDSWMQEHAGPTVDLSSEPMQERMDYLRLHGHPLMTIVYIYGHVFLYLGNYDEPSIDPQPIIMTYQNIWGLVPHDGSSRSVIGQAAFLPLLRHYKEDLSLNSLANTKYFKLIYLDQMPEATIQFIKNFHKKVSS